MSLGIWVSLFFIMHEGFSFLEQEAGAFTQETVEKVFNIFYASLMIMLFFSSTIIFYGGMYRSQEVAFLITTPTSPSRIFNYKIPGSGCTQQLGIRTDRQPHDDRVRHRGRCTMVLLPFAPPHDSRIRIHTDLLGSDCLPVGRELVFAIPPSGRRTYGTFDRGLRILAVVDHFFASTE